MTKTTEDAFRQRDHYARVANAFTTNLEYAHTKAYCAYLDEALLEAIGDDPLGTMADICCGAGEGMRLLTANYAVGVDVSLAMLHQAKDGVVVQGDATRLPLATCAFDTVVMLGGVHHVNDRARLFAEVARILKPRGRFIFREPADDFFLWRWLRAIVYRVSPMLDWQTERPLRRDDTLAALNRAGLDPVHWSTHGFVGFCVFMNSDVLYINRFLRFIPGIAKIVRAAIEFDKRLLKLPKLDGCGLQAIAVARRIA